MYDSVVFGRACTPGALHRSIGNQAYPLSSPTCRYIQHIEEIVAWMGWAPWKITYASDYFPQLYDFAVQLIKGGNAYVCHQTKAEIEEYR